MVHRPADFPARLEIILAFAATMFCFILCRFIFCFFCYFIFVFVCFIVCFVVDCCSLEDVFVSRLHFTLIIMLRSPQIKLACWVYIRFSIVFFVYLGLYFSFLRVVPQDRCGLLKYVLCRRDDIESVFVHPCCFP